jgi:glycerophosphoryl diester phosphodiesterase
MTHFMYPPLPLFGHFWRRGRYLRCAGIPSHERAISVGGRFSLPPLILAHRGGAALAPENTLAGFANAVALGADGAELDLHLTRDGRLVVHHDYCLHPDLCRGESGAWLSPPTPRLRDLTYEELARYDVGRARPESNYAREHPDLAPVDGERVPLLEDVVALARKAVRRFRLFVELKSSLFDQSLSVPPETLAEETVAALKSRDYVAQSVIIGFDWRGLLRAKALEPSLECWFSTYPQSWFADRTPSHDHEPPPLPALALLREWLHAGNAPWAAGFDPVRYGGSILAALEAAGADGWFPHLSDATEPAIKEAHARGLKVGAWTVDDPMLMRALAARGIDAICTDRLDLAVGL